MKLALRALCALAAILSMPAAFAADGVSNRTQTVASASSAVDSAKATWDALSVSLRSAVSDLSSRWDAATASGGWSSSDIAALEAIGTGAALNSYKTSLLSDASDLSGKISSQRAAAAVSLETVKDEATFAYSSLTDAQAAAYQARIDAVAASSKAAAAQVAAEIARLKDRYAGFLAASVQAASATFSAAKPALDAAQASQTAWTDAKIAYGNLRRAYAAFSADDIQKVQDAFVALRQAQDVILSKIRVNLQDGVKNAVAAMPRLAAVRAELDAAVATRVSEASGRLSAAYADADKWFVALARAKTLLDAQTGSLARGFDAAGNFLWAQNASTGALAAAQYARSDVTSVADTLAGLASGGSAAIGALHIDRSNDLQANYVAEANAARSAVDASIRALVDRLDAESRRIAQLVGLRETSLKDDLAGLSGWAARRARIARFAQEAGLDAQANPEWPAKVAEMVASFLTQADAAETAALRASLGARATKLEATVNAALRAVVDRAVTAGQADQVITQFKSVRAKLPALLDRNISDVSRFALHYISSQIDVFVKKVEG